MDQQDKYRGALLGLAVGDAVGTALEFQYPGEFEPITDMIGGGPFHLRAGQWTDDTSMALCLAASLTEMGKFDAEDQMSRYCLWWRNGYMSSASSCFDIGNATRTALSKFMETGNPFCGSTDSMYSGNGSIMRLSPIPMFCKDITEARDLAAASSRTTHASPECLDACRFMSAMIWSLLNGRDKEYVLGNEFADLFRQKWSTCDEVDAIVGRSYRYKEPPIISGSGYVISTLEAALWAFFKTDNFRDGCLKVVNLGEDADTTGAVYGQIAGAYYGASGIPQEWNNKVTLRDKIVELADSLLERRTG